MSETVIKIENLSKLYRLGQVGTGTLSHDLNRWWAQIRGKDDPFATAVKWYELGWLSQSKGAELTGLSRMEFLNLLSRYHVSILQDALASLTEELREVVICS